MTENEQKVYIYVFSNNDGKSTVERLEQAVMHYCKMHGIQLATSEQVLTELFQVERTERGKPFFVHCPQIQFSISHSGLYWVCALHSSQIGLDLQEHVRLKDETVESASIRFRKIAHRFFHPIEVKFVDLDSYCNFFRVWAARESYVKYTGQGIDASFSQYCVIPEDEKLWQQLSKERAAKSWQAQGQWFWEIPYRENYTLCVCTKEQMECIVIDLE